MNTPDLDITRKTEAAFCALLANPGPLVPFVMASGPDGILTDAEREDLLTPPYAVFACIEPEEILDGSNAYQAQGRLVLLSSIAHTPPELHSAWLAAIKQALDGIEQPQSFDDLQLILSGFSILGTWKELPDDEGRLRCHALPLALGVAG